MGLFGGSKHIKPKYFKYLKELKKDDIVYIYWKTTRYITDDVFELIEDDVDDKRLYGESTVRFWHHTGGHVSSFSRLMREQLENNYVLETAALYMCTDKDELRRILKANNLEERK